MLTKSTIILTYHEPGLPLTEDVIYSAFVSGNSVAKVISPVADLEVLTGMFSDNYCLEMTVRFTRTNPAALPVQSFGLVSICTSIVRYGIEEYIKQQENSVKSF